MAQRGYYSLIQYCPDASRLEAANMGVVIFCPGESPAVYVRVAPTGRRVARFFGPEREAEAVHDVESMADRIMLDPAGFYTVKIIQYFINTRANDVILTPLRPIRVEDPEQQIEQLLAELVLDPDES